MSLTTASVSGSVLRLRVREGLPQFFKRLHSLLMTFPVRPEDFFRPKSTRRNHQLTC